jgi:redox-sensitive bicupin YhaK (pirin superfamily)
LPNGHCCVLIYVFNGEVTVNGEQIKNKCGMFVQNEMVEIKSFRDSALVLFVTDENAPIFKEGMYSGIKK